MWFISIALRCCSALANNSSLKDENVWRLNVQRCNIYKTSNQKRWCVKRARKETENLPPCLSVCPFVCLYESLCLAEGWVQGAARWMSVRPWRKRKIWFRCRCEWRSDARVWCCEDLRAGWGCTSWGGWGGGFAQAGAEGGKGAWKGSAVSQEREREKKQVGGNEMYKQNEEMENMRRKQAGEAGWSCRPDADPGRWVGWVGRNQESIHPDDPFIL